MNIRASFALAAFAGGLVFLSAAPAFAQDPPAEAPAVAPAPPPAPQAPRTVYYPQAAPPPPAGYVAPLYQQTQESYVPQSVAMSGPREIKDWEDGAPVPPGYHTAKRPRTKLIAWGAALFGSMYFFSVLGAAAGQDSSYGGSNPQAALWVPGVGPFIQMANTSSASGNVLLAVDGLAQTAGLIMLVAGIASPQTILVRNDLGKINVRPSPMVGKGMAGAGLVGSF